jgi:polysaccharide export outer membrane protein
VTGLTAMTAMMRTFAAAFMILTLARPLAAAEQTAARPQVAEGCAGTYVIGPDDVLDVSVWGNTEVSRTVPVRPDGRISLPLLNDVQAAGLTPMQLRDAVTTSLTPYIPEPAVSVLVREIHSVKVTVIGNVKTPGRYELKDRATVLDVLAMAGGLNEYADKGGIAVLRQESAATRRIPFPFDKVTRTGRDGSKDGVENFCVRAGDVILVP